MLQQILVDEDAFVRYAPISSPDEAVQVHVSGRGTFLMAPEQAPANNMPASQRLPINFRHMVEDVGTFFRNDLDRFDFSIGVCTAGNKFTLVEGAKSLNSQVDELVKALSTIIAVPTHIFEILKNAITVYAEKYNDLYSYNDNDDDYGVDLSMLFMLKVNADKDKVVMHVSVNANSFYANYDYEIIKALEYISTSFPVVVMN